MGQRNERILGGQGEVVCEVQKERRMVELRNEGVGEERRIYGSEWEEQPLDEVGKTEGRSSIEREGRRIQAPFPRPSRKKKEGFWASVERYSFVFRPRCVFSETLSYSLPSCRTLSFLFLILKCSS